MVPNNCLRVLVLSPPLPEDIFATLMSAVSAIPVGAYLPQVDSEPRHPMKKKSRIFQG